MADNQRKAQPSLSAEVVAYNVVAFPMAAGVLYPFVISPEVAALAMSGSSALVAVNALLLKRTRLEAARRHRKEFPGMNRMLPWLRTVKGASKESSRN